MYCNICGKEMIKDAKFCNMCGAKAVDCDTEVIEEPITGAKKALLIAGATILGVILAMGIFLFAFVLFNAV